MVSNQITFAEPLEGDALRKNVTHRLPQLNHTKLEALMQRVGKKAPKNFYNCLCRQDGGGAAMGVGVSYHPKPLEPYNEKYSCNSEGPPCMASGYGCWRFPLPSDAKMWTYCIEHSKYEDNSTIVDAIVYAIPPKLPKIDTTMMESFQMPSSKVAGDTFQMQRLTELEQKLFEKDLKYKNECLPSLPKNVVDDIFSGRMIDYRSWFSEDVLSESISIADKTDNICEEAIAVTLYLSGQQGKTKVEIPLDIAKIWLNKLDPFEIGENLIQAPSILSNLSNFKSSVELLDDEYKISKSNIQFRDAYQVFKDSKEWSIQRQDKYIEDIQNEMGGIDKELKEIDDKLNSALLRIYPTFEQIIAVGGPRMNNNKIWTDYRNAADILLKEAESKKRPLLFRRTGLLLKKNVIKNHRKDLTKKGCEAYIADRKKECEN